MCGGVLSTIETDICIPCADVQDFITESDPEPPETPNKAPVVTPKKQSIATLVCPRCRSTHQSNSKCRCGLKNPLLR